MLRGIGPEPEPEAEVGEFCCEDITVVARNTLEMVVSEKEDAVRVS